MQSNPRRALYAQLFGLFCVVAGSLALLVVGVGIVVAIQQGETSRIPWALAPYVVIGVGLVVLGRVVSFRYGGNSTTGWIDWPSGTDGEQEGPDLNALEELGYVTPEPDDPDEPVAPDRVTCPNCGVENDAGFEFCENCTSRIG